VVGGTPPPTFTFLKSASFDDANANGRLDIGERLTWTVDVTNTGTNDSTRFLFDDIQLGQRFVDITSNPDGTCSYDAVANQIQCPSLLIPAGATKELVFKAAATSEIYTDDDSRNACNQAKLCPSNDSNG